MNHRMFRPLIAPTAALGLAGLALGGCHKQNADTLIPRNEPTAASSEWVAPNPTEPAVPVTIPKTPMTNVPASPPAASPSAR